MTTQQNKNAVIFLAFILACALSGCASLNTTVARNAHKKGHVYLQKGEYKAAISETTKAIAGKSDLPFAYSQRGLAYELAREYDNALADYRQEMALQPKEALTHSLYVELLNFLRRTSEAAEHARRFLTENPQNLFAKVMVASTLEAQKRHMEAYELLSDVLPKLENSTNENESMRDQARKKAFLFLAHSNYSFAAASLGKNDKAGKYANSLGLDNRAKIHYIQGNWQQAVDDLERLYPSLTREVLDSSRILETRFLLGNSYLKLGNMARAKEAYEQFLAANQFEPEAFANLGLVYAKLGNNRQAIENYSSALKLNPDLVEALTNRGSLYIQEEKYNNAITDFSAVLAQKPRDTEVLYKRAYSLCMSGKQRKGKEDLAVLLRIEPGNKRAKQLLSQCASS